MNKKSIVNDLYQAAVISVLLLVTRCCVKILKIAPLEAGRGNCQ